MKKIIYLSLFLFTFLVQAQDLSKIYEQVNPAVVEIITEEKITISNGIDTKTGTAAGLGSGFMISDKQIITAAHVVQIADGIKVKFLDGEVIPANVISSFKTADIALIELVWPRKNAVTVKLGDSDKVKIGSQVFIVGAPFGLGHSFSSGYVSGFKRNLNDKNPFTKYEYIQTDASINTGNSGGPMFNIKGEVIGVVSSILTKSGGFEGIGFATTSNLTRKHLIEKKHFWSGVELIPLTGKIAEIFNLPQKTGFLVQRVVMSSPLGIIGVRGGTIEMEVGGQKLWVGGDIILSFNGIKIEESDEILLQIANNMDNRSPDDPVQVTVLRAGKIKTLGRTK
ncbi:MAG: hypothetical protein COB12_01655 [Flavobacterium sp.]|nr:MAG: hypothetical protein COB12_01655 [Flavobacterium sp.]